MRAVRAGECWPPVATVPEPVLSVKNLRSSGSTCRQVRGTDQPWEEKKKKKEGKILLAWNIRRNSSLFVLLQFQAKKRHMVSRSYYVPSSKSTFPTTPLPQPRSWVTYPTRSGCISCIWLSSLFLSALSSWNQQQRSRGWLSVLDVQGSTLQRAHICLQHQALVQCVWRSAGGPIPRDSLYSSTPGTPSLKLQILPL